MTGPPFPDADRESVRFAPGAVLLGRFRVVRLLGAGGMGEVYEAEDQELRESVALKTIRLRHSQDQSMMDRLRKEVQLGRRVSHPNVCRLFDVFRVTLPADGGESPIDCAIVTMELLRGTTLSDRIRQGGPMDLEEAKPLALQIAEGLQAAHEAGIVHRDLKSANVFLAIDGTATRAVITDFGLATTVRPEAANWPELSMTGAVVGTLAYMSPEQLRGEPATPQSDIYAFGVVLYEMVSGVLPFRALTPMAAALKRVNEKPEDLRQHLPEVPAPWHHTIHRCLALKPGDRFVRAIDVAAGLARSRSWSERPALRWTATIGAIAAIVVGSAAYVSFLKRQTAGPSTPVVAEPGRPSRPAVALFGFKNVSERPEFAYISTALDQGLGSELAQGERLRIVSGEEVARLKRELDLPSVDTLAGDTLQKVRASLGTDLIVLGSYTALGVSGDGRLRVDFRVQNTASGETVAAWSHTGTEAALLELISESGLAARDRLGLGDLAAPPDSKTPAGLAAASGLPTSSEARRLYAEALDELRGFEAGRARERFERTIKLEPGFALAHVGLAMSWSVLGYDARAVDEASRAVDLARELRQEQRLWIDGLHSEYTRDWARAIASYRRLVAEYPDEPDYVIRLADAQTSGGTPKDALETLAAARKARPALAEDPRVLLAEASAAEALGDAKRQGEAAGAAIARAERRGERLLVARASIALGRARQLLGDLEGALAANQSSLELYETAGDQRGVARAMIQLGDLARERNDLAGAERHLTTALKISRGIGSRRQITQSLNALASVYFDSGRFAPAAAMYDEAIRVSREVGDRNAEALALGNLASVRYEQGAVTEALALDERSLSIRRAIGDRRSVAFSLTNMAETAADLGRLDQAQAMYEESREINAALSDKVELSYSLSGLAMVALRRDDLPTAQRLMQQAIQLREEADDPDGAVEGKISLANVLVERGELQQAADTLMTIQPSLAGAGLETVVQAAVTRSALMLAQRRVADARAALSAAAARGTSGLGLASGVMLDLMQARVLAAEGKTAAAGAQARDVRNRMRSRQLRAFELEADLVMLLAQPNRSAAEQLATTARDAGFLLIARKARGA